MWDRSSGCALPVVSFLVYYTFQDLAIVDSLRLRASGLGWEGGFVALAPLMCVIAWLIVFHAPLEDRFQPSALRAVRGISAGARHLILWVGLIAIVLFFHFVAPK